MVSLTKQNISWQQPPMPEPLAAPGEIVDLRPLDAAFDTQRNTLLVKSSDVKVIQLIIHAGETVPTHEAQGEMIVHCVEGRASLTALGEAHNLEAGQLLYLCLNEPFSIQGIEDSSLLVTIIAAKRGSNVELIGE